MKKIILIAGILAIIGSCKKKSDDQAKDPGEFFISFKTADSTYTYKSGDSFSYVCGNITGYYPDGVISYHPSTYITPMPVDLDLSIPIIKFEFNYYAKCAGCNPDLTTYGNATFYVGSRNICKTDAPYSKHCPDNNGCSINFTDAAGIVLNSREADQPSGRYFYIDSVINYQYRLSNYNNLNYDKIIVGRFACRVWDPANKTYSKDLTEGKFRMPVWRNY